MRNFIKYCVYRLCYGLYAALGPFVRSHEVSILCYHSISDAKLDTAVTPDEFARQLDDLRTRGHEFVSLAEVLAWMGGGRTLPRKAVALTFDDGYADFETNALQLLEHFNAPATVFVIEDEQAARQYVGNVLPLLSHESLIRLAQHPLVTFGNHSATHANLAKLPTEALAREVMRPKGIRYFAYPGGNHSPEAARAIEDAGYEAAFSIRPGLVHKDSDHFLMPRNVILSGMPLWQVRVRTTKAIDWYRKLVRSIK
ncbi:MAG TPA: polysaccharide deacetylase family protein [Candidatus Paceibacterota bacterium]